MEYPLSRKLGMIGGALIIVGLVLPWFKFDMSSFADAFGANAGAFKVTLSNVKAPTFTAWERARAIFFIAGAFGVLALTQVPFASPGVTGRFFMVAGFAGVVLVGYTILKPPSGVLELFSLNLKPMPGIFVTLAGMALATYGGWEQVKRDLSRPAVAAGNQLNDWQTSASAQNYGQQQMAQQPGQQAYAQQQAAQQGMTQSQQISTPRVVPPDPFAVKPPAPPQ